MRISSLFYCIKEGLKNIIRNIWFSLASMVTIAACTFLFCLFFGIVANVQYVVKNAESTIGITVFFSEELSEQEIRNIGTQIAARPEVAEINFISAEEAWEEFKTEYFDGNEELAEGFADDNPLAGSASYQIFLNNIEQQDAMVSWLEELKGVRKVNYSNSAAAGLTSFNTVVGILSGVIIASLLAVSVFLISNTINVTAAFRKNENEIMRYIGATNFMIRAPFVVEGIVTGLAGAAIPLVAVFILYDRTIAYMTNRFRILSGIFQFLPLEKIFPYMAGTSLLLGLGIGFFASFFTIRKHLKV